MDEQTRRWIVDRCMWIAGLVMVVLLASTAGAGERGRAVATNDTWRTECGGCHVAYPPGLLPATSWRAIMDHLDKHFGVDASVDAGAARVIEAFLLDNAGRGRSTLGTPTLRITETTWFRHEHGDLPPAVWRSRTVNSAANCAACHRAAETGDFSERTVAVPR